MPDWVRTALPGLPATMESADLRAKKYERGIVDLVEALVMQGHLGQTFTGVVIELDQRRWGVVRWRPRPSRCGSRARLRWAKGPGGLGGRFVQGTVLVSAV